MFLQIAELCTNVSSELSVTLDIKVYNIQICVELNGSKPNCLTGIMSVTAVEDLASLKGFCHFMNLT